MEQLLKINGQEFKDIITKGALNLKANMETVNGLNVFPVPDGDTGTNMCMTIENGINTIKDNNEESISKICKDLSRGMLLGARGNSGVILSQIFKGFYKGLNDLEEITAKDLANAFISGVNQAYKAVIKPVEGTILTVARESAIFTANALTDEHDIKAYLEIAIEEGKKSLANTPNLLPVLKDANVIDSGGAGYIYILEGMLKAINGEEILEVELDLSQSAKTDETVSAFNADSVLEYGYCTEFILQLQNAKVNTKEFDIQTIISYLETLGDSIVALKDEDIVKVHVHTKDPGLVLTEMRKYGEFLSVKIENMSLQHNEIYGEPTKEELPFKDYAVVAVCSGEGIEEVYKELGVDYIVSGGQTMNPSAEDFLNAYKHINAHTILVLPNNSNIIMAAKQSAKLYDQAKVVVVPSKSIAEGYSALTMLDFENNTLDELLETLNDTMANVTTGSVTYSVRDAVIDGVETKKGDFIALAGGKMCASNVDKMVTTKLMIDDVLKSGEKEVVTIFAGADISEDQANEIMEYINANYRNVECGVIDGKQDIYSFIISFE